MRLMKAFCVVLVHVWGGPDTLFNFHLVGLSLPACILLSMYDRYYSP